MGQFQLFFFLVVAHLMNDFFAPYNSSLLGFSLYLINWWKNWSFKDVTLKDGEFLFLKNNSECCSWGCSAFVGCRPWCSKDVLRCSLGFHIVLSFRMWNHVMPVYDPPPGHKWLKKKNTDLRFTPWVNFKVSIFILKFFFLNFVWNWRSCCSSVI